ncbi:MAG: CBS domain-containing protein [Gammaproteobacteria bacterium]|nr:CBS domain-containing protein [Rhodocyclaceae bacterium]MBU3909083.1 CBS domain-containing protein [Gammaproteobacteria bacterium]MBU3990810.1 CBS domain-containing protein [Gammaproteobacteria bacterium]MBU4003294.1 CBS domain-containing protein [Gammaproteobacteria bacterium]MBU4022126.1 CBS domain-containing protein [Gammaproteobacteria bacterium]
MFSIYGMSGPVFRGSLEELKQVRQLHSLRAVRPIATEGEESGVAVIASPPRAEAIHAYQEMLHHDQERGPLYLAEQVMQRQVITVAASDDVAQAWRTLHDHHIHQAPVLDDAARLIGVVSERNLLTALNIDADRIIASLSRQVRDVMTTPVVATAPLTDIRLIATVMLDQDVDGVPIVDDNGRLVGFVSRSDILRAVVADPPLSLWR